MCGSCTGFNRRWLVAGCQSGRYNAAMKRLMIVCGGKRMPRFTIEISFFGILAIVLMVAALRSLYAGGATARFHAIIEMGIACVVAVIDSGFWRPHP